MDEDQSEIRKNKFCENCGHHAEVLLGIELQPHPHAKELVFSSEPSDGIYRSDLQFGSNFGQAPRIFAGPTAAEALKNSSLTGVTVVTTED